MKKIITILSFITVLFISCGKEKKVTIGNEKEIQVKISSTATNDNEAFVTASGKIESENSANVSTRMSGYVTKVHVKMGQKVAAGQLLVSIDNTDLQAKKAQANAAVLQAVANYNNAKKDFDRFTALFNQQSASQKELDDMTSRYEMAKAGLEAAKQMRNEVTAQFSYSNITAPFSGEITNTFVKEGDLANPGMPLIGIEGASQLQVTATVPENAITAIKNGMIVKVLVKSVNKELSGKVVEVSGSAKNTGGQYLVKVNIDYAGKEVLPGMFVSVQFPFDKKQKTTASIATDKVLIPKSALIEQGQLTGIYTVGEGNIAILRWIRVGKTFGSQIEVLSGLSANENYIVSSEERLFNGAKVKID